MKNDFENDGPAPEEIRRQVAAEISARIDLQFTLGALSQSTVATAIGSKPITMEEIIAATKELNEIKDRVTDLALWCYAWQRAANFEGMIYEHDPFNQPLPIYEPPKKAKCFADLRRRLLSNW